MFSCSMRVLFTYFFVVSRSSFSLNYFYSFVACPKSTLSKPSQSLGSQDSYAAINSIWSAITWSMLFTIMTQFSIFCCKSHLSYFIISFINCLIFLLYFVSSYLLFHCIRLILSLLFSPASLLRFLL